MYNHRYILQPYKGKQTRFECPDCKKPKEFARYIDFATGEYIALEVGRCNREQKCGYHYKPHQYFENHHIKKEFHVKPKNQVRKQISYIEKDLIIKAMRAYETNKLVLFLKKYFNEEKIQKILKMYYVGTSNHWPGTTVFPQIDIQGRVRTAKLMQYDQDTGKRKKKPFNHITWLHTVLKKYDFNLEQCLFGEHLIRDAKTVCIVESEKTCLIAALVWPQFTWVATGGKNGAPLKPKLFWGKQIILFPDLGVDWSDKAEQVGGRVSEVLNKFATPRDFEEGYDLVDFLLREPAKKKLTTRPEFSPGQKAFDKMATINPNLKTLKDRLDLSIGRVRITE